MIDFHNHVLPNVDDGSISLDMSIKMLSEASKQGITEVVNTVHYQHPKFDEKDIDIDRINGLKNELEYELENKGISIKLHLGSEVFYYPNLLKILDKPLVTIGKGKYMLIEFHPQLIPKSHKQHLFNLKMAGVTPIIAHPERYKDVQENISIVNRWLEAGCIIQIDAGSILGKMGKKAYDTSIEILKNSWCQILGSDAHNDKNRNFMLKDAYLVAEKIIGTEAILLVQDNPKKILEGSPIHFEIRESSTKKKSYFWNKLIPSIINK